jgi:hypothetical protein
MSELRAYKFLVMPVVQILDEKGNVTDEGSPEQPDIVFGLDGLHRYADGFEETLALKSAQLNEQKEASTDGQLVATAV